MVSITIGQTIGLILLGFTSIYREGFETVLFLQSLVLEAGSSVVLRGVGLGLLGTAAVGVITFSLQVRLPYKKMLIVTGVMIGGVLLTMVGHTVHVLQAVGWLPITPISNLYLPYWMGQWFGLFATWQGILLQIAAAGFVIGSYFLAEHQTKRIRRRVQPVSEPSQVVSQG
jgi:high-affinity iron transporter